MSTTLKHIPGLRKAVYEASPYVPGKTIEEVRRAFGLDEVIKLGSNENPYAPFPASLAAMREEVSTLNTYPDNTFEEIKDLIARRFGLTREYISIAHGAGGMLQTLAKTFLDAGDEAVLPQQTYGLYREITKLMGGVLKEVPLDDEYRIDLARIAAAVTPKTKLIWLCNPNNPTGTLFEREELLSLLDSLPEHVWVVLDEAYAEFAEEEQLPAMNARFFERNVIRVRTFSKAYGLAGARIGYAVARPEMTQVIDTVAEPFNANRVGIAGAIAALTEDGEAYRTARASIIRDRERINEAVKEMGGTPVKTSTNFVFFRTPFDAASLSQKLLQTGVIVRPCAGWGYPDALRVTVGTTAETDIFLTKLSEALTALKAEAEKQESRNNLQEVQGG